MPSSKVKQIYEAVCRSSQDGSRTSDHLSTHHPDADADSAGIVVDGRFRCNQCPDSCADTRGRRRVRTRIATLNCRTLLADETLTELDMTLTENNVSVCALQEVLRVGFMSQTSKNYKIFWFGEHPGRGGVGFAIHTNIW